MKQLTIKHRFNKIHPSPKLNLAPNHSHHQQRRGEITFGPLIGPMYLPPVHMQVETMPRARKTSSINYANLWSMPSLPFSLSFFGLILTLLY